MGTARRHRRCPEARIPGDHRERGMFWCATAGSEPNGTAPQGKVARKCPRTTRRGVSRASEYNLAPFAFGSVRCRVFSPDSGAWKFSRLSRRAKRAGVREDGSKAQSIEAHAGVWDKAKGISGCENKTGDGVGIQSRRPYDPSGRKVKGIRKGRKTSCHIKCFLVPAKI